MPQQTVLTVPDTATIDPGPNAPTARCRRSASPPPWRPRVTANWACYKQVFVRTEGSGPDRVWRRISIGSVTVRLIEDTAELHSTGE